jgi:hypothetical protein
MEPHADIKGVAMSMPAGHKLIIALVILPSLLVALSMLTLYFVLMPLLPAIHQYYFYQSWPTYLAYPVPIYGHIIFGAIALILGPINLFNALRGKHFGVHKKIGGTYAVAVSVSATCAIFMAFHAYAGTLPYGRWIVTSGFATLGCLWLGTLYRALYLIIIKKDKRRHFFWMIINISLVFSAVIFRVENGTIIAIDKFDLLYPLLGWCGWLPSAIGGYLFARQRYGKSIAGTTQHRNAIS